MYHDPEIEALSNVNEALTGLDRSQVRRITTWVIDRFNLERSEGPGAAEESVAADTAVASEAAPAPVKARRGRKPRGAQFPDSAAELQTAEPVKLKGFLQYESLESLFKAKGDALKRVSAKILVAAAFFTGTGKLQRNQQL